MSTPNQRSPLQSEHALRFTAHGASFRMGIVACISQILEIIFCPPRILVAIFSLPVNRGLPMSLVAFHRPIAGPGEPFMLNVGALFGGLRRRELRSGSPTYGHDRQHKPRSAAASQF